MFWHDGVHFVHVRCSETVFGFLLPVLSISAHEYRFQWIKEIRSTFFLKIDHLNLYLLFFYIKLKNYIFPLKLNEDIEDVNIFTAY